MAILGPVGPGTPYITPSMLTNMPLGISWATIPSRNATNQQQLDAQFNICQTASAMVDGYCGGTLRATINSEQVRGPHQRVAIDNGSGEARIILSRWPVTQVLSVQVSPAAVYPRQFTTLAAGLFEPERPLIGVYGSSSPSDSGEGGQAILVAPGYVNWRLGRNGYRIIVSYINGWPHTALTADAAIGATTITVDDCTAWAPQSSTTPGAVGIIFEGSVQEAITCTAASATSGPGTLTLALPLGNGHAAGSLLSALPGNIRWATALFAASQALTRGATATTVQGVAASAVASKGPTELAAEAELILQPFRRVM